MMDFMKMLMESLKGRGGGISWNKNRKILQYLGEQYVILGEAVEADSVGGLIVVNRDDYAAKKALNIQFVPAEFLIEVYPGSSQDEEHADMALLKSGHAADEELDNLIIDANVLTAPEDQPNDPLAGDRLETFRNKGRYKYPELSFAAKAYLDIDLLCARLRALISAKSGLKSDEQAQADYVVAVKEVWQRRAKMLNSGKNVKMDFRNDKGEKI